MADVEVAVKKEEKKKEKKNQLSFVWTKDAAQTYQPSPIIYQKCPSSILSEPPPGKIRFREGGEQRKYAIQNSG